MDASNTIPIQAGACNVESHNAELQATTFYSLSDVLCMQAGLKQVHVELVCYIVVW